MSRLLRKRLHLDVLFFFSQASDHLAVDDWSWSESKSWTGWILISWPGRDSIDLI